MTDRFGQPIYVGSEIVYTTRQGDLSVGKVLDIQGDVILTRLGDTRYGGNDVIIRDKDSKLTQPNRVMVVTFSPYIKGAFIMAGIQ